MIIQQRKGGGGGGGGACLVQGGVSIALTKNRIYSGLLKASVPRSIMTDSVSCYS